MNSSLARYHIPSKVPNSITTIDTSEYTRYPLIEHMFELWEGYEEDCTADYKGAAMALDVHEPVEVSAVFARGRLKPVSFMWNRRHYKITEVTGAYRYSVGISKCYGYTVRSGAELYEISLNTGEMVWTLERIHNDLTARSG